MAACIHSCASSIERYSGHELGWRSSSTRGGGQLTADGPLPLGLVSCPLSHTTTTPTPHQHRKGDAQDDTKTTALSLLAPSFVQSFHPPPSLPPPGPTGCTYTEAHHPRIHPTLTSWCMCCAHSTRSTPCHTNIIHPGLATTHKPLPHALPVPHHVSRCSSSQWIDMCVYTCTPSIAGVSER